MSQLRKARGVSIGFILQSMFPERRERSLCLGGLHSHRCPPFHTWYWHIERLEIADLGTNNLLSLGTLFSLSFCGRGRDRCGLNQDWSSEKEKGRTSSLKWRPQNFPLSQDLSLSCCACTSPALPQQATVWESSWSLGYSHWAYVSSNL